MKSSVMFGTAVRQQAKTPSGEPPMLTGPAPVSLREVAPQVKFQKALHGVPDAALTARNLVVVAALGESIWYLQWKISVYFAVGH
jgi:hypothetical protein